MGRRRAYLLSSEWVQESPRRYGRHVHLVTCITKSQGPDSNRSGIAIRKGSAGNCVAAPPPWHSLFSFASRFRPRVAGQLRGLLVVAG